LIPSLKTGKIDCIISSMTDTPERRGSIDFSEPYLSTGLALLVPKGSDVDSVAELDQPGKTVAVRQGTTGEVWSRAHIKNAQILALEKESAAVMEVVQGKADAFLYDQMSVWENARRHPEKTQAVLQPIREEKWAIGLRQGDDAFREQVNAFLKEFRAGGGFERLGEKYLSEQKKAFREQGIEFYF
jgi:polar amino acid transport system substrate-binding protein